jgi:hypothetical protein
MWRPFGARTNGSDKAMPRRNSLTRRLLLFGRGWDEWDEKRLPEPDVEPEPVAGAEPPEKRKRRLGATVSFCALFFAGLALSAGAGNGVRALLEDGTTTDTTATVTDATSLQATPAAQPVVQAAQLQATALQPRERTAAPGAKPGQLSAVPTASHRFAQKAGVQALAHSRSALRRASGQRAQTRAPQSHTRKQAAHRSNAQPLDAEANSAGATVWLYRAAPDPTPPASRLRVGFARELVRMSRQSHLDWALVLAVLRADGHNGRVPATAPQLRTLTFRLAGLGGGANPWAAALSYSSQTTFADRVVALRHYYRAVGLASLVHGLLSQQRDLEDRVLHDSRISIYAGGRNDIASHRVDVRVLAVTLYLAETFHQVTVSCLISGHRLYARPGVISAHIYGRAADIAALGGVSIYGHQQPGGVTEQAVRSLLMLPGGMLPAQIISLLGLGGPSFPLANHYDHIHVGF